MKNYRKTLLPLFLLMSLMLNACGSDQVYETAGTVSVQQEIQPPKNQVAVHIPVKAVEEEKGDRQTLYDCGGYTLSVQTMQGGDIDETLRKITGFSKSTLRLMETERDGIKQYSCVWTTAGEPELQVGRACILDDGSYHYAVSVLASESEAGKSRQAWKEIFDSVGLIDATVDLNTGS